MGFWDQENECMPREEIEQLQLERLQATLNRVYKNVRHFRKVFRQMDFMPEDLRSLKDFKKLPFTSRQDLLENYPYGMFSVPLKEVVRLNAPALILDKPLVMGFTNNDLNQWAELVARNLTAVGIDKEDVVQVSLTFGIITGAFGVQLGAERIGASVIPMSSGNFDGQVKIMRDFRTTTLVSTPSFALTLAHTMDEMGVDSNSLSLKYGIFGAEPWAEETRDELEVSLNLTATDSYGLTEVFGPGVAWECPEKNGLHIPEDHFLPEIIDPKTLEPQPPGVPGELVLTTITKEAYPLIRYRTGDMTQISNEQCSCGRTHCRIKRIFERCDDVVVIRGMSIIPDQIGRILSEINGTDLTYQLVIMKEDGQDQLQVQIEISDKIFFDEMKKQREIVEIFHKAISESVGFEVKIKLVEPNSFDSSKKVEDKRKFR